MPINGNERRGLEDLFTANDCNVDVLKRVATNAVGNIEVASSVAASFDMIFTHVSDARSLLMKKYVTKQILFSYLHNKQVALCANFTKDALVTKILEYWNTDSAFHVEMPSNVGDGHCGADVQAPLNVMKAVDEQSSTSGESAEASSSYDFNVDSLGHTFSKWFFDNWNEETLTLQDFWLDVELVIFFHSHGNETTVTFRQPESVLANLMKCKQDLGIMLNPNLIDSGAQTCMDIHGLVMHLSCGTIHTRTNGIGVYECAFGLVRDPFAENNWKVKSMKLVLRYEYDQSAWPAPYGGAVVDGHLAIEAPMEE